MRFKATFLRTCVCLLLFSHFVVHVWAQTLSPLTVDQASQRVEELEEKIAQTLAATTALSPKDQFETIAEYNQRKQTWAGNQEQSVRSMRVVLVELHSEYHTDASMNAEFVSYDADLEELIAAISGEKMVFKIARATARQMYARWAADVVVVRQLDDSTPGVPVQTSLTNVARAVRVQVLAKRVGLVFGRRVYPAMHLWDYVYSVGDGTTAPSVLSKVDPEYPEEALRANYGGSVILSIIVNMDGKAEQIVVVRSLLMGLDEKAIEAVKKWLFLPGKRNGVPVNVRAKIEVHFTVFGQ